MNLAAILLGVFTSGICYRAMLAGLATPVAGLAPWIQVTLALALELVAIFIGGAVTARLSCPTRVAGASPQLGPERKPKLVNAGIMALLAGCLQIAANGGGLHVLRFFVLLFYVPVALWGAGKAPWRGRRAS